MEESASYSDKPPKKGELTPVQPAAYHNKSVSSAINDVLETDATVLSEQPEYVPEWLHESFNNFLKGSANGAELSNLFRNVPALRSDIWHTISKEHWDPLELGLMIKYAPEMRQEIWAELLSRNPECSCMYIVMENAPELRVVAGTFVMENEPTTDDLCAVIKYVPELLDVAGRVLLSMLSKKNEVDAMVSGFPLQLKIEKEEHVPEALGLLVRYSPALRLEAIQQLCKPSAVHELHAGQTNDLASGKRQISYIPAPDVPRP